METLLFAVEDAPRSMLPIVATGLFFAVILAIAAWGMKKTNDTNDFFLGGRTLGPWILALSYGASYFSAVVFIGFAGTYGWLVSFKSLWIGLANGVVGGLAAWLVLGRATRKMTRNLDSATIPEFFAQRYGSNFMKILGAAVIFVFLLPYSASVFAGLTYLFKEVFNISMTSALTIITVATGVYIVVGGYKAAARIDFLQGAIIIFGALFMALFAISYFAKDYGVSPGVRGRWRIIRRASTMSAVRRRHSTDTDQPFFRRFMTDRAIGAPRWRMFYAIKDKDQIVKGAVVSASSRSMSVSAYGGESLLFCCRGRARSARPTAKRSTRTGSYRRCSSRAYRLVPSGRSCRTLASMSTLCSLALTSSAALSLDLVKGFVAPNASEKTHLAILRICCGIFIICSYFIALFNPSWIVALTALSWGAICGGFLAPYVYGLFWRGTTKSGAIAGMLAGIIVSNAFYWFLFFSEGAATAKKFSPVGASIAMVLPFIVVPVVSAMTKKLEPARVAKAFADEERVEIHVPVGEGSAAVVKGDSLDD